MAIKMNPITLDAELVRGDTGTFSFTLTINEKEFLTDEDRVWFTLKKIKGESIILQKEIKEFPNGVVTIPIPPSDTANLEPGNYIYDLKLYRKDGNVDTLLPNGKPHAYFALKKGVK